MGKVSMVSRIVWMVIMSTGKRRRRREKERAIWQWKWSVKMKESRNNINCFESELMVSGIWSKESVDYVCFTFYSVVLIMSINLVEASVASLCLLCLLRQEEQIFCQIKYNNKSKWLHSDKLHVYNRGQINIKEATGCVWNSLERKWHQDTKWA